MKKIVLIFVVLSLLNFGGGGGVSSQGNFDSIIQTVRDYYTLNVAAGRTGNNWLRVLIALGAETHDSLTPFTAAEAWERVPRWGGWRPVAEALEQLERQSAPIVEPTPTPMPTSTPLPTNTPAPTNTPVPTNTPAPLPTNTPLPTSTPMPTNTPVPGGAYASLIQNILGWRGEQAAGTDHYVRWTRALAALGYGSHNNPMTASEAQGYVDRGWGGRWQPVVNALTQLNPPPPPTNTLVPTSTPMPTNTPMPTSTATATPTATIQSVQSEPAQAAPLQAEPQQAEPTPTPWPTLPPPQKSANPTWVDGTNCFWWDPPADNHSWEVKISESNGWRGENQAGGMGRGESYYVDPYGWNPPFVKFRLKVDGVVKRTLTMNVMMSLDIKEYMNALGLQPPKPNLSFLNVYDACANASRFFTPSGNIIPEHMDAVPRTYP